jgi:transposase
MTTPLPQDLRQRIVRAVEKGGSFRQATARYEVSPSAAVKIMRRVRETGPTRPDRIGGHRRPGLEPHQDLLRSLVEGKSGITLAEIQAELRTHPITVQALSTIHLMLKRMGLTHKKDAQSGRAGPAGRSARASTLSDVAALHGCKPLCLSGRDWHGHQQDRRYGGAPGGQRAVDAVPHGHWLTTTFMAGLRGSGIVAPLVVDGPMGGEISRAYVEQMLASALSKGDVVVLDNLAAHKVASVVEAIREVGASLLHLPARRVPVRGVPELRQELRV